MDLIRLCLGIWLWASVKIRRNAREAIWRSSLSRWLFLSEVVITGRTLSMVWMIQNISILAIGPWTPLTFRTTLKLYESSRCKTFEPMNVKTGMTVCKTASGTSLARLAISNRAWLNVCGFSDTAWKHTVRRHINRWHKKQNVFTSDQFDQSIQTNSA